MWEWQGLMDSNHRMTESESVALPLGEAPIKKALHWSAVQCLKRRRALSNFGRS